MRELLLGPRRYKDLLGALDGIGTNLLAARLRRLEEAGVVEKTHLPPPASVAAYELTARGRALEPVVTELARWGLPFLQEDDPDHHYSATWAPVAMQAAFRVDEARGVHESYEFRVDEVVFHARVDDVRLEAALGPARDPACRLETDLESFRALVSGRLEPGDRKRLRLFGDPAAFERCGRIFALHRDSGGG